MMNCELVLSWVVEQPMMEVWSLMAWMIGWENFMKVTNHDPSQARYRYNMCPKRRLACVCLRCFC